MLLDVIKEWKYKTNISSSSSDIKVNAILAMTKYWKAVRFEYELNYWLNLNLVLDTFISFTIVIIIIIIITPEKKLPETFTGNSDAESASE
jgi:hypothetical protein